jgi:hypothetical protein
MNFQEINRIYAFIKHLLNILTALLLFFRRWFIYCRLLLLIAFLFSIGSRSSLILWAEVTGVRGVNALARFHHLWQVVSALLVTTVESSIHLGFVGRRLVWNVHVIRWRLVWNPKRSLLRLCVIPSMIKSRNRLHLCWKMRICTLTRVRTPCQSSLLTDIRLHTDSSQWTPRLIVALKVKIGIALDLIIVWGLQLKINPWRPLKIVNNFLFLSRTVPFTPIMFRWRGGNVFIKYLFWLFVHFGLIWESPRLFLSVWCGQLAFHVQ